MIKVFNKYIMLWGIIVSPIFVFTQDKISIESININTSNREYTPVYYKNGLVFSSEKTKKGVLNSVNSTTEKNITNLFFVPFRKDNQFGKKSLFSPALKTKYQAGAITFSRDGKTAYFTRSLRVNKKSNKGVNQENNLGIYKAIFNEEEWGDIVPCSFNSEKYNVGHPSLSSDGKRLYVVSSKRGGEGGRDIYYSEINEGICGPLINLGNKINSDSNEEFPFIATSGRLYFSSDKKGGIGGLDIYSSILNNQQWDTPTLLDTTINSKHDDFSLVWNKNGVEGYFASDRNGSDDIYKIKITYPEFKDCEELKEEQLCFEFFEEATVNADSFAMIYEWDFGDGEKEQTLETYHCYDSSGLYIVTLSVMDTMIESVFINEAIYELELEEVIQPQVDFPDFLTVGEEFSVEIKQGKWTAYTIENYYIDYGDSTITKNDGLFHQYYSAGIKEFRIIIAGKDQLTNTIRTNCFYKTIKVNPILKTSIQSEEAFTLNKKENFLVTKSFELDIDVQKEEEFYMLELMTSTKSIREDTSTFKNYIDSLRETFNKSTNLFSYSIGKTDLPKELIEAFYDAHQLGFDNAQIRGFKLDGNTSLVTDFGFENVDAEGNIVLSLAGVHFDYEKDDLNTQNQKALDKLITYLQSKPDMKIEVEAHTDNKGEKNYNLKLSQKRAKNVLNYLVKHGINTDQLEAIGYGESKPIASNETEEGRAQNRRVTFKILLTNNK